LFLNLWPIHEAKRKTEHDFWNEFRSTQPEILGLLFDGVSASLVEPEVPYNLPPRLGRMADFHEVARRSEGVFWPKGTFDAAYAASQEKWSKSAMEKHPTAQAIVQLAKCITEDSALRPDWTIWTGSVEALLNELSEISLSENYSPIPDTAVRLGIELNRIKNILLENGIEIERTREGSKDRNRGYTIRLTSIRYRNTKM